MIRQVSSTPSWRVKRIVSPSSAACSSTSYGRRSLAALLGELEVELDAPGPAHVGAVGVDDQPDPCRRVELDHELVRLGCR